MDTKAVHWASSYKATSIIFCVAEPQLRSPHTRYNNASSRSVVMTLTARSRDEPMLLTINASVTFLAPATRHACH